MKGSIVLVACVVAAACRPYGSIASLATAEVRTSAVEFAGRWRAPDVMRCRSPRPGGGGRWSSTAAFEVRADASGWLRITASADTACPADTEPVDSLTYVGDLVRLGEMRLLELSLLDESHDETLLPLRQWHRVTHRGDTLFLEQLNGDSLHAWLLRSPKLTPHLFSSQDSIRHGTRRLVLTGDAKQLQSFARRAFGTPGMVFSDTLTLVRDRPAGARGS